VKLTGDFRFQNNCFETVQLLKPKYFSLRFDCDH